MMVIAASAVASLAIRPAFGAVVNFVVIGTDGWLLPEWDQVRSSDPATIRRVAATLSQAVAKFAAAHITVAISLTPAKSRVYRNRLPEGLKWSPQADQRYRLAIAELRRPGTLVPDQAALFAAARERLPDDGFFFKADTHWTAQGAELSANLMAEQIARVLHLPPSAKPGQRLDAATAVTQDGNDLAALLPREDRANYPPQTYMVRKPAVAPADGLLDDDAPDVVVIGNSFVQPAYGYASYLSDKLNRPVGLFWRVHQMSPYWTMLRYLESESFKTNRPRLIVWNLAENDMEMTSANTGVWGDTAMTSASFLANLTGALSP